nr:hypothetical protein [Pseudomonas aeruginosa]
MSMEMNKALDLLRGLVSEVERKTCCHEETHRGGAIWEICDSCGAKWADDEGGKPEFAWPESVEKARAFLATHPAVEQAGGNERAGFEAWLAQAMSHHFSPEFDLAKYEDSGEYRYNPAADYWKAWQARAALAHRAPEVCSECSDTGKVYDESGDGPWSCYACTGNPEVIGYANGDELDNMLDDRTAVLSPGKTSFHNVPVYRMIRAALAQPSPKSGDYSDQSWINAGCPPEQPEQAEAERPEVVARVVHSNPVVLGQCGPLNANDELMTVAQHAASVSRWAEMFNRVEQQRDAALARVAELEKQEPVVTVAKVPGEDWNSLDFHRDLQDMQPGTKLYAAPVAQAQQLHDLDKQCRDDVARALGLRPNKERGFAWSYLLASIKSCVKASGDSAQAQHSVPEGWMLVECGIWTQEQVDEMQKTVTRFRNSEFVDDRALAMAVADAGQCKAPEISLAELLAAAPGKEGV